MRLSHETVQVGDVVGIEYASNVGCSGRVYTEALGEYEVIEDKRCICLKELKDNWFHKMYGDTAIRDFGENMFILIRRDDCPLEDVSEESV